MKITLKCATGGYKYGDVVETSSDGSITAEIAKGLVKDGFATEVKETPTAKVSKKKK